MVAKKGPSIEDEFKGGLLPGLGQKTPEAEQAPKKPRSRSPRKPANPPAPATPAAPSALEERLAIEYKKRATITATVFLEAEQKAALAIVQPLGFELIGSKGYTESAILRALVELLLEAGIDWRTELATAGTGEVGEPRDVLKEIIRKHLPRLKK